jgi:hypothetical protein
MKTEQEIKERLGELNSLYLNKLTINDKARIDAGIRTLEWVLK